MLESRCSLISSAPSRRPLSPIPLLLLVFALLMSAIANCQSRSSQLIRVYKQSRDLAATGRTQEAIRLLSDNIVYDSDALGRDKTLGETNARLLSLLAGFLHKTSSKEIDLFRAESYAAWAIGASYCEATYWKLYVDIRLDRETYAPFIGAVRRGESTEYPLQPLVPKTADRNSPSHSWTLTFPRPSVGPL